MPLLNHEGNGDWAEWMWIITSLLTLRAAGLVGPICVDEWKISLCEDVYQPRFTAVPYSRERIIAFINLHLPLVESQQQKRVMGTALTSTQPHPGSTPKGNSVPQRKLA